MVQERNSEEIPEEPLASAESAPAPHYAPAPYAPPPPGAWAYEPMFMPAPPSYGHPAPAYGHPEPAPAYGHPEPGPYFVVPAPYHAPAPHYDPKLEPFHPSKMPEFKTYSYKFVAPAAPAPKEEPSIDLRTSKAIDDDSAFENELPKESDVKEGPFDVASIVEASIDKAPLEEGFFEMCGSFLCPKEAPIEEAPLEEVSIEEELLEDAAEEDFILEEEIFEEAPLEEAPIEEIVTEEPLDEESVTEAIVFLSEIDQVSSPSRFF